jgi:two-component system chemotaxis response regulator CheY
MNKKVLIVDDSTFMRMVLKDIVASHDPTLDIFEADGEKSALLAIRKEVPNLVLLDIIMNNSEVEGINILRAINSTYTNISVIMITSVGHASVIEECESLGAKGYIKKPFDPAEIKEEINKYL